MRRMLLALLLVIAASSCRTMTPQTGFLDRSVIVNGTAYPYVVYVPRHATPARRLPVILFLHGAGERGSDGLKPTQVGVGSAIRFEPSRVPALVVFPQVPLEQRWLGEPADAAMAALDRATAEFRGDPTRTYVTGLSLGGYGTLHLALAHPGRFAALVVVCGGLLPHQTAQSVQRSPLVPAGDDPYAFVARALRTTPVWLFHGADDPVIPADEARRLDDALRAAGGNVRYTEYAGVGHNAWDKAYADDAMWSWLFAQRLQ